MLHEYADKVKAGFFYTILEQYDEDGSLSERMDPLEGSNMKMTCLIDSKGKVSISVPPSASPIVFVPKYSAYLSQDGSKKQEWTDTYKKDLSYYPLEMDYINGSLMVVPHSSLYAYYISNKSNHGSYNLRLPK